MSNSIDSISNVLSKYKILRHSNLQWPDSITINNNSVDKNTIDDKNLKNIHWWLRRLFKANIYSEDSCIYLKNMVNNDDWVIFKKNTKKVGVQVIDGRQTTVFIRFFDKIELNSIQDAEILELFKKFFNLVTLGRDSHTTIDWLHKDSTQFVGDMLDRSYRLESRALDNRTFRFFLSEFFLVVEIQKIRYPYLDKFGYNSFYTIGGVDYNYSHPFIRFSKDSSFDYRKEMIRVFPWVLDSIDKWKNELKHGTVLPPLPLPMIMDNRNREEK